MRNLHLKRHFSSGNVLPNPESSVFCLGEQGCIYDVIGLSKSDPENQNNEFFHANLTRISECAHLEEVVKSHLLLNVFQMQFLNNTGYLYFTTTQNQFAQYHKSLGVEELFESEFPLLTFSVAPDSRFVSIINGKGNLLLFSLPSLELVIDEPLYDKNALGDGQTEKINFNISWRHDSRYFVVNTPTATGRALKFFNNDGQFFSQSEESIKLSNSIVNWQPSGELICAVEEAPLNQPGHLVTFFELNGLKRFSFNPLVNFINLNKKEIKLDELQSISFNAASDLIAIMKNESIEIWYRTNYLWSCKYTIKRVDKDSNIDKIKFYSWDREVPYKLYVIFESGHYSFYDFKLDYSSSLSNGSNLTVSFNGENIYCTPYRDSCAPPPYSYHQYLMESRVKEIILSSFYDGFLVLMHSSKIVPVQNSAEGLKTLPEIFLDEVSLNIFASSYNWIWPNKSTICFISERQLHLLKYDEFNSSITYEKSYNYSCSLITPLNYSVQESNYILGRKLSGALFLLDLNSTNLQPKTTLVKLPSHSNFDIKYLFSSQPSFKDEGELIEKLIIFYSDTRTNKLFACNYFYPDIVINLSSDCTSIGILDNYLMYTRTQGTLQIIDAVELEKAFEGLISVPREYGRKVEKGSIILTCCWNKLHEPSVVLQIIPRGNTETICPRPLVISSIHKLLRSKKEINFNTIMVLMRKHRVNANSLIEELVRLSEESGIDIKNCFALMVSSVKETSILELFVTEISGENLGMVEKLKEVFEELFSKEDEFKPSLIQPYLVIMAKLGLYKEILNSEFILGEKERERIKSRIKFLSFYADNSEILYEAALGTYDLNLASIVADCLNKDPKEFLPILNQLKSLPLLKRRFTIDNSLKLYSNALTSLILDKDASVDEIVHFTQKHKLFNEALCLIHKNNEVSGRDDVINLRKCVQSAFGSYLKGGGKYGEASLYYRKAGDLESAIECELKSGNWEYALILKRSESEFIAFTAFCSDTVIELESKQDWAGAARLCELYLNNYERAIENWVLARKWTHALGIVSQDTALDSLTNSLILPNLIKYATTLEESLNRLRVDSANSVNRLKIIRKTKLEKLAQNGDGGDNFSDTESVSTSTSSFMSTLGSSSAMTGKTYRSGKNKRKLERKIYSLKEGSLYEDIAIIVCMWDSFNKLNQDIKEHGAETVKCLWKFEQDERAMSLTTTIDSILKEVDGHIKEIWSTPIEQLPFLDIKYTIPPTGWKSTWDKFSFSTSKS